MHLRLIGALLACACAVGGTAVSAQGSYSPYDESASAAMARYIRDLASDPKDFDSLIGAGRSALALGDPQAAAGFFARADEVNPRSPLPQAGMGAVAVANGEPQSALPYFKRAQQLGAPLSSLGCDRGLAYDLMGQQAQAQADYRAAMAGRDADEARKRLAISLAISGNRSEALQALAPLAAKGEPGVARVRAFVLALTGDANSAVNALNAVMPGSGANVAPFLQRLPALAAGQKAAAANLGIFPDSGTTYASAASPAPATSADRLGGIDAFLRPAPTTAAAVAQVSQPAVQASYAKPSQAPVMQRAVATFQPKIWLQLSSGQDADALASRFKRFKAMNPDVFEGIKPYVAQTAGGSRLLVGPFRGTSDASIFAEDLQTIGISANRFTDSPADRIAPLQAE